MLARVTAREREIAVRLAIGASRALLFSRSLRNLVTLDAGFRQDGLLIMDTDLRRANVPVEARPTVYERIVDRPRQPLGAWPACCW